MHHFSKYFYGISIIISVAFCNLLGPTYPAPRDISSDSSLVAAGWKNITSTLKSYINGETNSSIDASTLLRNITFSAGIFSLHDPKAQSMQFHYAGPETRNATTGTNSVDGDTIYRVASVTKLVTVLGGLLELTEEEWDRSLADLFPAFAKSVQEHANDPNSVFNVRWDQVTLRALSAHLSGVQGYLPGIVEVPGAAYGLPNLTAAIPQPSSSLYFSNYTGDMFAEDSASEPPAFLPWTGPAYSNNGYLLLGAAIAKITGRSVDEIVRELIFDPLDMNSSSYTNPHESEIPRTVAVGNLDETFSQVPITFPSGGMWSTTNDLAKLGVGILNSTLLPPDQTRRWMKPVTHTAQLQYAIGRPWEIYRYIHPESGIITDIYTKAGDSGPYGSMLALLPDFDAGFSIITASADALSRGQVNILIADIITESILPALMNQAARETESKFAGSYASTIEGQNSSMTFSVINPSEPGPGLVLSSWINNGTDLTPVIPNILGLPAALGGNDTRLVPTVPSPQSNGQLPFRTYSVGLESKLVESGSPLGLFQRFYDNDWLVATPLFKAYGGTDLLYFVFDVDTNDRSVKAVSPAALKITLERRN